MGERSRPADDRKDRQDRDDKTSAGERDEPKLKPTAVHVPEEPDNLQRRSDWFEKRSGSKD